MKKFLAFLTSVKLAVVLIVYLVITGIIATLIPQGHESAWYTTHFPKLLAQALLGLGFHHFFDSVLFILPVLLFFINLSACTIKRFVREVKKSNRRRFGPDLIHLGLMVLVIGCVISFSGRQEGFVNLRVNEQVALPGGYTVTLTDFKYLLYDDGRPKDWISVVQVKKNGEIVEGGFGIEVNKPLKIENLTLYQASHGTAYDLVLADSEGKEILVPQGERVELAGGAKQGGISVLYMAPEQGKTGSGTQRVVIHVADKDGESVLRAGPSDAVGPYRVKEIRTADITGIQAVIDPGYLLVFIAFILIGIGVFLTFIQKLGDMRS